MMVEAIRDYSAFIQEAFIDPIRSVLIIDDKYPTIEQVLTNQIEGTDLTEYENPQQILNVIKGFRKDHPALIVDVHDGSMDLGVEQAQYLHQSDLLILDYELEDDGSKSVAIAKNVFSNNHFNLIVVHTNSEPEEPFRQNLLALLTPCENLCTEKHRAQIDSGQNWIAEAESEDSEIAGKIQGTISFQQYIHYRHPRHIKTAVGEAVRGEGPFKAFRAVCEEIGWEKSVPSEVFMWALSQYETWNARHFGSKGEVAENWSIISNDRLWVRTSKGFITFVKKQENIQLLDELRLSIEDWNPSPSRLMSARLRSELDDQGVIAEDQILGNKLLHAKFYSHLYTKDTPESRRAVIDTQISRQLEDVGNLVKASVTNYMDDLISNDKGLGEESSFLKHYGVDLASGANSLDGLAKVNAYVSCYTEVCGWHLAPGHILEMADEKWVCLSPACDLVPGQKATIGVYGDVGNRKPFLAVKLHKKRGELTNKQINSNNFLFLLSDTDSVDQYSFYDGDASDPDKAISPHWSLFIAEEKGVFNPKQKKIRVVKIGSESVGDEGDMSSNLKFDGFDCQIVAQLRYEYALNLIHKLGVDQTRVGLGYISG